MAEKMVDKFQRLMSQPEHIRNIATCAHIDHGKTTFSDNLIAGAGMMSQDLAGKACVLDFHEDEQTRGITIDAAAVSMVHSHHGKEFLINLIDTPGHVDFGGDVTRAMRAIDGAIVLVDAVEGMMPQTETVLRQALRERVKPVLFINKVDRLIKEIKLTPEKMQERFLNIITNVNKYIRSIAEDDFKEKWQVDVNTGSVAFGSAIHKWALSVPYMKKNGIGFKDVIDAYEGEKWEELSKRAPLHEVILDMSIKHHPNPVQAQGYRIPKIWRGEVESEVGKSLLSCDPKGQLAFVVTKIVMDRHAGEVAAGRIFSGTMVQGMDVYMNGAKKAVRLQQVSIYNGAKREIVDNVPAGNIVGVVGLNGVFSGETISQGEMHPFEEIKHIFEPVVTKAIEAKKPSDLPKLIEVLRQVNKEDPTIQIEINEETGEHLMHGMGELHLEVIENRIRTEKGVEVQTSPPIVVYRETILRLSPEYEGKSPNKHNKLYFKVSPVEPAIAEAIREGKIAEGRIKKKDQALWEVLEAAGMESKVSRKVRDIFKGNLLIDMTRGIVHIGEVIEMVMDMFEDVMKAGPLAREPCINVKVEIMDLKLHEDAIHRGPAQMYPAVRDGIRGAMMLARPVLYEPVQTLQFEAPEEFMGEISKLISNKRGQLLDMQSQGVHVTVKGKLPVAEMFGMTSDLRSATEGRGHHYLVDQTFERLPEEMQAKVTSQIRERKGIHAVEGEAVSAR
ncbi:MAG: elongation factor EF-2 [Nanoarchaeota archaeon]